MSTTYISDKQGKPRKSHCCRVCDEAIEAGELCHIYKGVESGEGFYTLYFHLDCWKHSGQWDWWDWDRSLPGDITRKEVQEFERLKLIEGEG